MTRNQVLAIVLSVVLPYPVLVAASSMLIDRHMIEILEEYLIPTIAVLSFFPVYFLIYFVLMKFFPPRDGESTRPKLNRWYISGILSAAFLLVMLEIAFSLVGIGVSFAGGNKFYDFIKTDVSEGAMDILAQCYKMIPLPQETIAALGWAIVAPFTLFVAVQSGAWIVRNTQGNAVLSALTAALLFMAVHGVLYYGTFISASRDVGGLFFDGGLPASIPPLAFAALIWTAPVLLCLGIGVAVAKKRRGGSV